MDVSAFFSAQISLRYQRKTLKFMFFCQYGLDRDRPINQGLFSGHSSPA
jgi:hypothetical protein